MKHRFFISLIPLLFLGACAPFSPEFTALPPAELPASYQEGPPSVEETGAFAKASLMPWWESFQRQDLNALQQAALGGNFSLAQAWARLQQADATVRKSGASFLPSLSHSAGSGRSRSQRETDSSSTITESASYDFKLSASYEVDLWGRVSSLNAADLASREASLDDLRAAMLTVSASIAETWVDILSVRAELEVLQRQTAIAQSMLDLQSIRFANGQATGLDVVQQHEQFLRTESEKPLLQLREKNLMDALAVLVGRLPGSEMAGTLVKVEGNSMPSLGPLPPLGLPIDMVAQRPDIRAAASRLQSTDRSLAASKAAMLPALTLSAQGSFSSGAWDLLFSNWLLNLASGLTGPLFDGGSRQADVDRMRAVAQERLAAYGQTVAVALQEVEAALRTEKGRQDYYQRLEARLEYARLAEGEARERYFNGLVSFTVYIMEVQSVQSLERSLVQEQANILKQRIALCRALGGTWMAALMDTPQMFQTSAVQ